MISIGLQQRPTLIWKTTTDQQNLEGHSGWIFSQSNFIQDGHSHKFVPIFIMLDVGALTEGAQDPISCGKWTALEGHHLGLQ